MIKQILDKLNIKTDSNQKWILLSLFISGLLIRYTGPVIAKSIITALPAEWIAFQSLFSSISALIIGMMWQGRIRRKYQLFIIKKADSKESAFLSGNRNSNPGPQVPQTCTLTNCAIARIRRTERRCVY